MKSSSLQSILFQDFGKKINRFKYKLETFTNEFQNLTHYKIEIDDS